MRRILARLAIAGASLIAPSATSFADDSFLSISRLCQVARNDANARISQLRAQLTNCNLDYVHRLAQDPDYYGRDACPLVYVVKKSCLSIGQAICAANSQRDQDYAGCHARARVMGKMEAAARDRRIPGFDEAKDSAGALNEAREDLSPAHALSAALSEVAHETLNTGTRTTIEIFDRTLSKFDSDAERQSFLDQAVRDETFVPFAENEKRMALDLSPDSAFASVLDSAETVQDEIYGLPFGDDFASAGENADRLAAATELASTGDMTGLRDVGAWDGFSETTNSPGQGTGTPPAKIDASLAKDYLRRVSAQHQQRAQAFAKARESKRQKPATIPKQSNPPPKRDTSWINVNYCVNKDKRFNIARHGTYNGNWQIVATQACRFWARYNSKQAAYNACLNAKYSDYCRYMFSGQLR